MPFADPYDVMSTNPYLSPPAPPNKWAVLGNVLTGLGAGISAADASGRGWAAGIAPGAQMAMGMIARSRQADEEQRFKAAQYAMMTDRLRLQDQAMQAKTREAEEKAKRRAMMGGVIETALGGGSVPGFNVQPNPIQMGPQFADVIGGMESGGRYDAVGPVANNQGQRAYGKYQVMDFNVGPWTQEVLGQAMTPQEFLANPQAQDAVFKAKFGQYVQKHGSPEAASRAWFAGEGGMNNPNARDVLGTSVADYSRKFNRGMGGPQVAQAGGAVPQGDAAGGNMPQIDPRVANMIRAIAVDDPEKAAQLYIQHLQGLKKDDAWYPVGPDDAKMYPGLDPNKAYQRNRVTGEIKQVGTSPLVTIDQKGESEFVKEMAKKDAERLSTIQANEDRVRDVASKVGLAVDMMGKTYTGPAGEWANEFFRVLGGMGVESAAGKANAAAAATAVVNQLMPYMRAPGSGATSDFEMRTFAGALPALSNMPGGNELIAKYFERMAERAAQVRALAEKFASENKGLTGTRFADEVKALGPLFSKEEIAQMQAAQKGMPSPEKRRPLNEIMSGAEQNRTPMPGQRPPLSSILGAP